MNLNFPKNFFWGAGTSSHQVEGNNFNNDWWAAEQQGLINYQSEIACDHKRLFEQDIKSASDLNHNAHKFSIEWSRIEPEQNKFDEQEIIYYRKKIIHLREQGLEPIVVLNHFTLPLWLSSKGGWQNTKSPFYFERFTKKCLQEFGDYVNWWLTFNEPNVYIKKAYLDGDWPPFKKSWLGAARAGRHIIQAHQKAYKSIKDHDSHSAVSLAYNFVSFQPARHRKTKALRARPARNKLIDKIATKILNFINNEYFLRIIKNQLDFVAVNYYLHQRISFHSFRIKNILPPSALINDMGWEINPKGLLKILKSLKKFRKPILITENGIADRLDYQRSKFILSHLLIVYTAIAEGVDVRGYFYSSLLDGYEWQEGFRHRFGLIKVDFKTGNRYIRPSAQNFAKIAKQNGLSAETVNTLQSSIGNHAEIIKRQAIKVTEVKP